MSNKSKHDEQIISHILSNQGKERGIQNYACYELLNCEFSVIEKNKIQKRTSIQTKNGRLTTSAKFAVCRYIKDTHREKAP